MLTPLVLARRYLDAFMGDAEAMRPLLADGLVFEGPLFRCRSAAAYVDAILDSPIGEASYEIVAQYEDERTACLIYWLRKAGTERLIVQHFETAAENITRIRTIFDPR